MKRGDVAICGKGLMGLITRDKPVGGTVWKGIHLGIGREGDPWQSNDPRVIGHIGDFRATLIEQDLCPKCGRPSSDMVCDPQPETD